MDLGTSGKGGKKALDSALNLVPFIDLMAVLIVFLIMSAVWTQLNRLQVAQAGSDGPVMEEAQVPVCVRVSERTLLLTSGGTQLLALGITRDARGQLVTQALTTELTELKRAVPQTTAITVEAEDAVPYEDLIRVIDAVTPSFPSVTVSPAGG